MYDAIETEDDKVLLDGLMRGDYEAAFLSNAQSISPLIQIYASELFLNLSMGSNGDEELQALMNALLKPQPYEGPYQNAAGGMVFNANSFRHLENLYAGNVNLLSLEAVLLMNPDILQESEYQRLLVRNEKLTSLATLYGSCYDIVKTASKGDSVASTTLTSIDIRKLVYDSVANTYSYTINYQGQNTYYTSAGPGKVEYFEAETEVFTTMLDLPSLVDGQIFLENMSALEKAKAELEGKLLEELVTTVGLAGLTTVNPPAGAVVGLIYSLVSQDGGESASYGTKLMGSGIVPNKALEKVFKSELGGVPADALKSWLSYQENSKKINSQMSYSSWEQHMKWFGAGGTYHVGDGNHKLVVSGVFNPVVLERVGAWERDGLQGLAEAAGVELEYDETNYQGFLNNLTKEESILWSGGDILNMDQEDFQRAVNGLTEKGKRIFNKQSIDIRGMLS